MLVKSWTEGKKSSAIRPEPIAKKYKIIAFEKKGKDLKVAMLNPEDIQTIDFIRKKTGLKIITCLTTEESIESVQESWRRVCATALENGIPVPALTSALCYFDGFRNDRLPVNLLQAQRDYFGAHQYERVDKPRGEFFHTDWTGRGGSTASSTYQV